MSILNIPSKTAVDGVERYEVELAGEAGIGSLPKDVWWKVAYVLIGGQVYSGFVAEIHKGERLMNSTPIGGGTPPSIEIAFPDELNFFDPKNPDKLYKMRKINDV